MKINTSSFYRLFALSLVVVLMVSAYPVGQAFASTGCFPDTNGFWAETFICWLKDNGITSGFPDGTYKPNNNVTRAEMAIFLQKLFNLADSSAQTKASTAETNAKSYADSTASTAETNAKNYADSLVDTPPSTGNILVSSGFSRWVPFFSADPISFSNFANGTYIRRSSIGTNTMVNQPDIPVVVYGKRLQFAGVEICYETATGNFLSEVRVRTYTQSTGLASSNLRFSDTTDRTGPSCIYYALSTPIVMTAEMGVEVFVDIAWTIANTDFGFGRTTFVFQPTTTSDIGVSSPTTDANNVVILQTIDENTPDQSPEAQRP